MNHDVVTVRYQVADIERSASFYRDRLGFQPTERFGTAFGAVTRGNLRLILSGPGSSGSRPMPNGQGQAPGGWNRIVLYVDDLSTTIGPLEKAGVRFRNQVEVGPGGKQILIEDPDGNPIELHEAPREPAS
jgi:catechol 2,3-dioxygenase-like lactoylglutathione lyase family enzyme